MPKYFNARQYHAIAAIIATLPDGLRRTVAQHFAAELTAQWDGFQAGRFVHAALGNKEEPTALAMVVPLIGGDRWAVYSRPSTESPFRVASYHDDRGEAEAAALLLS